MTFDFDRTRISLCQRVALTLHAANDALLTSWWIILNDWQWPENLPDPEPVPAFDDDRALAIWLTTSSRGAITSWIENMVGKRTLLRTIMGSLTDAEFDDYYLARVEANTEALERERLRAAQAAFAPLPTNADGKYGRINANEDSRARGLRIIVNGEDVSPWCYEANDVQGYALCYNYENPLDPKKVLLDERGQLSVTRKEGAVVIQGRASVLNFKQ